MLCELYSVNQLDLEKSIVLQDTLTVAHLSRYYHIRGVNSTESVLVRAPQERQ